jgi:fructose-specific PTS system IIA-like component
VATTLKFACDLRHGLHARPASLIAQIAEKSKSRVSVRKTGADEADARSVLSVIALDIQPGNPWEIVVDGADEAEIANRLESLVHSHFGETQNEDGEFVDAAPARVPAALQRMGVEVVSGTPASRGVGRGTLVFVRARALTQRVPDRKSEGVDAERARLKSALEVAGDEIQNRMRRASGTAADLLAAHRIMLDDSQLLALIEQKIAGGMTAECAVAHAAEAFGDKLRAAASALIRERAADVQDLAVQILSAMGVEFSEDAPALDGPSILVSHSMTPGQLLKVDATNVAGLVLGEIGLTSHVIILARSMGVPAIAGAPDSFLRSGNSAPALIDGTFGFVAANPSVAVNRLYDFDVRAQTKRKEFLASFGRRSGKSRDGASFEVGANASSAADVERAIAGGADGIGLFRTEFLYLGRAHAPTEEELVQTFSAVVKAAAGRPVIFRTFDIGADKPAPFLHLAGEENPFLGARGARLYKKHATLLRTQIRSIVKAAAGAGNVKIMAPMVTNAAEMKWFREQVRAAEKNLANGGLKAAPLQVGMMLEIPAAAANVRAFAEHADFFSLGTNDLGQYWFAADRGNAAVATIVDEMDISFLELIRKAARDAKKAGKWIGMCGEMASRAANLPVLLGLGLDEISVAGASGAEVKYALARLDRAECGRKLDEAIENPEALAEGGVLSLFGGGGAGAAPIADELIQLTCEATTKEEAIREMVGMLFSAGRTDRPGDLEEDVWAREATYSTGLGFGFAVPHCRTKAVDSVSVTVGRLPNAIEWGSNDGLPVRHALLLAVPEAGDAKAHLQVLARLARKLVHEEFRAAVEKSQSAGELGKLLKMELGL